MLETIPAVGEETMRIELRRVAHGFSREGAIGEVERKNRAPTSEEVGHPLEISISREPDARLARRQGAR